MIDEIPWNKNVWAKTIMLVTGFKNWGKKKRQKKNISMFFLQTWENYYVK